MSITGPGSITATNLLAQNNMSNQLNTLAEELGTGEAATTYSGLQSQAGLAVQLSTQLADISGYSSVATSVGTTLSVAQTALSQLSSVSSDVQQLITDQSGFTLDSTGQTTTQESAASYFDQIISLLNTQVGGNYLFSGSATDQASTVSASEILNGNGTQDGLIQVIQNQLQADEGVNDTGRLSTTVTGSQLTLSSDGSSFGFQLSGVSSSLTGGSASGPSGSPPTISVNVGADTQAGDTVTFNLTLPDGSTQDITLTATTASPPGTDQFTIGSSASSTATNLQTALNSDISNLAQTALPAASAIAAANNFFSDPPQVPNGPPYDTATSLVDGTSANTVLWYTGENGSTSALQTQTAQVGSSLTVSYGMRATESAITSLLANVGVLAATTYSASNTDAQASYEALCQQVNDNLSGQSGTQSITDIESQIADAQTTVTNATSINTQTQTTLQDMLQGFEGVNQDAIGEDILTLQNDLSASLSVTARLAQLSLVNDLSAVSG